MVFKSLSMLVKTPTVERAPFSKETKTPLRLFRVMGRHWAGAREKRSDMHPLARARLWDMHFGHLPEHAFGPECPWYARGSCFRIRLFGRIAEHAVHARVLERGATPWGQKIFTHPPTTYKIERRSLHVRFRPPPHSGLGLGLGQRFHH